MDTDLTQVAEQLSQRLLERGLKIALAESCTGGWVAKILTDIAGSSAWFDRAFVSYSNAAKRQMLGVPERLLSQHGAVSAEVVEAMAQGALTFSDADVALAISGIAGPGGGREEKPLGTVWLAWACVGEAPVSKLYRFDGGRDAVRRQAVATALQGMIGRLDG
ncbi:MAG: nicotinamide-nucleotide amidase [Gammaproteobacteria bacterium]|nr:nicotinamide-nucleotide amidase [Gammaproteobacteria bacterium]